MTFSEWLRLISWLAAEAAAVLAVAALLQGGPRSPGASRTLWRAALASVALLWLVELSGLRNAISPAQAGGEHRYLVTTQLLTPPGPRDRDAGQFVDQENEAESPLMKWPAWIWLAGSALLLARSLLARVWLGLHRRAATTADDDSLRLVGRLKTSLGLDRVEAQEWANLQGPVAFGIFRPAIALPPNFTVRFSEAEREAMLAHEMAHLAARDPFWLIVCDAVTALAWWHPMLWWARAKLQSASEAAADEASTLTPGGARVLAECLVRLGREMTAHQPARALGLGGHGRRSLMAARIERLLRGPRTWRPLSAWARWTPQASAVVVAVASASLPIQTGLSGSILAVMAAAAPARADVAPPTPPAAQVDQPNLPNPPKSEGAATPDVVRLAQTQPALVPGHIPPAPTAPTLVFDSDDKRYDAAPGEKFAPFIFNLTNVWTNEIIIDKVVPSCGCTVPSLPPTPWHLPTGAGGQVRARMNLQGKTGLVTKSMTFHYRIMPGPTNAASKVTLRVNIPTPATRVAHRNEPVRQPTSTPDATSTEKSPPKTINLTNPAANEIVPPAAAALAINPSDTRRQAAVEKEAADARSKVVLLIDVVALPDRGTGDLALDWLFGRTPTNDATIEISHDWTDLGTTNVTHPQNVLIDRLRTEGQASVLSRSQFTALRKQIIGKTPADLLSAPKIETASGVEAEVGITEVMTCVTGVEASPGGINYFADPFQLGIHVDILPKMVANGDWRLRVRSDVTSFIGYDKTANDVIRTRPELGAKSASGVIPHPHFRAMETKANETLALGQTLILRGPLWTETTESKSHFLFSRKKKTVTQQRLYVFVTTTAPGPNEKK